MSGLLPERLGSAAPDGLARTRAAIAAAPPPWPPHPRIRPQATERNGVPCLEFVPPDPRAAILYMHGGGYRLGRCEDWSGFAAALADRSAARVVLPEYRLAPEHPFPAALNDVLAVLDSTVAQDCPLIIAGDSAGGGLAAAATLAARSAGRQSPGAVILISPWLDLMLSAASFDTNADCDRFFPRANAAEAAAQYLQDHPATDPLVSPLFADLRGFPPSLILAGGDETLLADSTRFVERLALAGTSVDAHVSAGMQHVWPLMFPDLPETGDALGWIARFVSRISTPGSSGA